MRIKRDRCRPLRSVVLPAALLLAATLVSSLAPIPGLGAGRAAAQAAESGAQSTFLDPSIRASGMGRAAVAVFWGDDPEDWANPSLLSQRRGVHFEWGRSRLVPDLAEDVYFTTTRLSAGAYGVGVSIVGKPWVDVGEEFLDYGKSYATDVDGNIIGTFHSHEEIRSIGFGVSLPTLFENLARATGGDPPRLSRVVDVSVGHAWKTVLVDLAPAFVTVDQKKGAGEARTGDTGIFARVTPRNTLDADGLSDAGWGSRVDFSAGWSFLNDDGATISFIDVDQADPIVRDSRLGLGARLLLDRAPEGERTWLSELTSPLLSFGATWERSRYSWRSVQFHNTVNRWGLEAVLANVVSIRTGHVDDPVGTVQGFTWGFGAGFTYRGAFGVRYDFASVPQSRYLVGSVDRNGVTAFVDPIRLWTGLR